MSFDKNKNTMVRRSLQISGIIISMALLFTNCENIRCIKGNDNMVTEEVEDIGLFDEIVLESSYDVFLTQDTTTSVSIRADDNLIPYITADVIGNKLILSTANRRCIRSKNDIRIVVTTPNIKKIELEGSGDIIASDITLDDIDAENILEVVLDGSGDIDLGDVYCDELYVDLVGSGNISFSDVDVVNLDVLLTGSGNVDFLSGIGEIGIFTVGGSGNIYADKVRLLEADVDIPGSGDIFVWAEEHLYGQISGSGHVVYRIFPTKGIHINITGSGVVEPL